MAKKLKRTKPLRLQDVRPTAVQVGRLQQRALLRLQLRTTSEIHLLYSELSDWLIAGVSRATDDEGFVDGVQALGLMPGVEQRWAKLQKRYVALLTKAREQAASLPFGSLVIWHNYYFRDFAGAVEERLIGPREILSVVRMWQARRQRALEIAAEHIYSDGFNLSTRIWRLENTGLQEIRVVLSSAMSERTNAADLARSVEHLLGASQDCPRWTTSRLYRMTPADRVTSQRGLLRGDECQGQGLAYKALRLARNEIQIAHHRMTDEIAQNSPWVTGENIVLSPQHPQEDICDEVVSRNPYAVGEISLPIHPQCLCYKTHEMSSKRDFVNDVRGYVRGENDSLSGYAEWSGLSEPAVGLDWQMSMADSLELWLNTAADGHAEALAL